MPNDISSAELMELYKEIRSTRGLALKLHKERGLDLNSDTIRKRLKRFDPNYADIANREYFTGVRAEYDQVFGRDTSRRKSDKQKKEQPFVGGSVKAPDKQRRLLNGNRYVFTAAQNNTYVHENFLAALLHFCEDREATLVVSQFTYNQSGFQNLTKEDGSKELWYDHRLKEYFIKDYFKGIFKQYYLSS